MEHLPEKVIKALGIVLPAPQSLHSMGLDFCIPLLLWIPPSGRLPGLTVPSCGALLSGALTVARGRGLGTHYTLNCFPYTAFSILCLYRDPRCYPISRDHSRHCQGDHEENFLLKTDSSFLRPSEAGVPIITSLSSSSRKPI